jgi:hypothetical protein
MIATLAKMLGLSRDQADASMRSEPAAKAVLSRRNFFVAGAAMTALAAIYLILTAGKTMSRGGTNNSTPSEGSTLILP